MLGATELNYPLSETVVYYGDLQGQEAFIGHVASSFGILRS